MTRNHDTEHYDALAEWLSATHQSRLYQACAGAELTPTQFIALQAIERLHEPRMAALATDLGLSPGGLTTLLDRLVRQGLVERVHDAQDRRGVHVRLLPKGATALHQALVRKRELIREPFLQLDTSTRQQILTGLEALRSAWVTLHADAQLRKA